METVGSREEFLWAEIPSGSSLVHTTGINNDDDAFLELVFYLHSLGLLGENSVVLPESFRPEK